MAPQWQNRGQRGSHGAMGKLLEGRLQAFFDAGGRAEEDEAVNWLRRAYGEYARLPLKPLKRAVRELLPNDSLGKRAHPSGEPGQEGAEPPNQHHQSDVDDPTGQGSAGNEGGAEAEGVAQGRPRKRRKKEGSREPEGGKQHFGEVDPVGPGLDSLSGMDHQASVLREAVLRPVFHPEVYSHVGVNPPTGVLLHGPPGTGKTRLANAVAHDAKHCATFFSVAAPELVAGVSGESEQRLRQLFTKARAKSPAIIFIDEIDALAPKRENAQREMERRVVAQLLSCMDAEWNGPDSGGHVSFIAATNRPDDLDPALRRAGRFDREILVGVPDEEARARIIAKCFEGIRTRDDYEPGTAELAKRTPGYVAADLSSLVREAASKAVSRTFDHLELSGELSLGEHGSPKSLPESRLESAGAQVGPEDVEGALRSVQPSATREGFATVPEVGWHELGAMDGVREELEAAVSGPINDPAKYERMGLLRACGVLLHGPPGCGKTLVAKATAAGARANFISVKGPEMLNKYVGESERAVRAMFARARAASPCVLFFDELDALAPRRGGSSEAGPAERVVNQLLTELDGLEPRQRVFLLAATNRPDVVDPAILRPGRLDKLVYIGLPGQDSRLSILNALSQRLPLATDVDLKAIAADKRAEGLSGADLGSLLREAGVRAMASNSDVIAMRHLLDALDTCQPSVDAQSAEEYERLRWSIRTARSALPQN